MSVQFEEIRDEQTDPIEERNESSALVAGPGVVMTRPQFLGGGSGMLAGAFVFGGLALLLAAILRITGVIGTTTLILVVVGLAVAGAVTGLIAGGREAGEQRTTAEERGHDRWVIVSLATADEQEADRARRIFERTRAERVA